ncbi:phage portal protein [Prolixibacteraceae bacterium A06]|uniref:Phage portal protein n=1 Tax=Gaoshiqia sediminis TaxID=2986998 RepID=A0AA41Y9X4_9BACT|nr:phage portal protein [Gaoshiqia sediminis]MCW0484665.1 phage portal protein [Gaoshiqia sediminis]
MGIFSSSKIIKSLEKIGIHIDFPTNGEKVKAENISTIQTCTRILVENVSRLPVVVRNKEGQIIENHIISKLFNKSFNNYISGDTGRKLTEKDRITNGNSFIRIIHNSRGDISSIIPYPYESVAGITLSNNSIYYSVDNSLNPYVE